VFDNCKRKNLKVGVWIRALDFEENEVFYESMVRMGVDFICSDYPLKAMASRNKLLLIDNK
jgi:hypothetical protein